MPSLGIAPHPEGCVSPAYMLTQDAAPVSGVFPAGASFSPAGDEGSGKPAFSHITRVPYRAVPYAWARPLLSWHAIVPFRFPVQVSHQTQEPPFEFLPAEPGIQQGASRRRRGRSGCYGVAVVGLARCSASAWMLANEARTAASHAAATRSPHHCPAHPKSVPSSPEYSSRVEPVCSVRVNSSATCGTGPRTSWKATRRGRSKVIVSSVTAVSRAPWTGVW